VEEGLSLEGKILRYSSMSLSLKLGKNEKLEQHITKKTHKPNALRFWVEGTVISLYGFWLSSHCLRSLLRFLVEGSIILLYRFK